MDLLYLIRSGLRIPDYWHPHLDIQTDFLSGNAERYPISMDIKADYPGQLDDNGIPIVYWGQDRKAIPSPVNIVLYGLGSHDAFLRTQEERYRQQFVHVLRWLENRCVTLGQGIGWPYQVEMPLYHLTPPWFSAITQGLALSLFVRAYELEGAEPWSRLAHQTWLSFRLPVEEGGFTRRVNGGVVYEEYPGPELDCVFNGMCCALIGLWEAWRSALVPEAEMDFYQGLNGLRSCLPQFDCDHWSLYSLSGGLGKPFLASPYYHRANALLAQVVGLMANDQEFCEYGQAWLKSDRSILRRIGVSLRIGLNRYLHTPSLLHFDKSKPH